MGGAALLLVPTILAAQQDTVVEEPPVQTGIVQAPVGAHEGLQYSVRTSSPRETLSSFQQLGAAFQKAFVDYKVTHDRERAARLALIVDQWRSLIDLSQVPAATRREVGAETAAYLLDIFSRIALPALGDVPDDPAFTTAGTASYLIPRTPFRIIRIDSGPRQGEFLFSGDVVQSAPRFYRTIDTLPLRSPQPVSNWVAEFRQLTGPLVPVALHQAVPENLKTPVLGTPIWKIIAVGVLTTVAVLLLFVWNRLTTHPARSGVVGNRWWLLPSPLAAMLVALGLRDFFAGQIIVAGQFAAAIFALLTLAFYLAMAWAFWVFVLAAIETAVNKRNLPEQSSDANILRLIAKIIGVIGGIIILAYGGQDIGLPVFSMLAGLGIGGIAIALAIRPTLENLIGGFIIYLDKPIRVGDFCTFGESNGTVESIGVRSTQIRALDRTLITVPNAQFADMQIVNWAQCDRMLIKQTIGLRYETDEDQLRYVIVRLREMLIGHPRIDSDTVRVRFSDFGASSLDIAIRVYALTREWNDFYAIKEDVQFRIMSIVEQSGAGFAFPSQTLYMGKDDGPDPALIADAKQEVAKWRRTGQLPFPNFADARQHQLDGKLSYPPPGSPDYNATPEELEEAGSEPLSAEPLQEEGEPPAEKSNTSDPIRN